MSDRAKVLSIREGLRALSQTMVVLSTGIFILQVYGAITPTYRSIVHWSNTREQEYCSLAWENLETIVDDDGIPIYSVWESSTAYDDWYPANGDTTYKVFYLTLAMMMVYIILKMKDPLLKKSAATNNITLIMKIER